MEKLGLYLIILTLFACGQNQSQQGGFIGYVNPFIGTAGKGKTYPGATVPFGMVQLSPDNGRNGWDWISGYFYPDTVIAGFSHTHLSGTGAGDLYDISFLPTSGILKSARLDTINPDLTVYSLFSHNNEQASPGYYQVYLDDYKVNVELTSSKRSGLQRYTFEGVDNRIRLNLGYSRNWDKTIECRVAVVNDTTIVGYRFSKGWAPDQRVFFVSILSKPMKNYQLFEGQERQPQKDLKGKGILLICDIGDTQEIMVKTGISSVSIQGAANNLFIDQKGFDFERVRSTAEFDWEVSLRTVDVTATEEVKTQFYTAMYHSMLAPTLYSDADGQYYGSSQMIYRTPTKRYSTFSLWDTYRAQHPWLTITQRDKVPNFLSSILAFGEEHGRLPVWTMMGKETNMMIGYHSIPVLTDALLKGFEMDTLKVYELMKRSAMQDEFGIKEYRELGYVPYETGGWSVSKTMEYAYDDWCIAQVSRLLKNDEDHHYFMERSSNYQNHFDSVSRYFRAKNRSGDFKTSFNALAYYPEDYCEANAMQYFWYVPHNVEDMIRLSGGEEKFEDRLDELFSIRQNSHNTPEWISGYIGQYVHGNEPSHHVPYLYQFINEPKKTQRRVRQIMNDLYSIKPDGLAGNEDCGQMSAWYLFSAIGFYPVNPADGKYIFGSPIVEEATIHLPQGKTFVVKVNNGSIENKFVESVTLNGKVLTRNYITHDQIMNGGRLVFVMGPD